MMELRDDKPTASAGGRWNLAGVGVGQGNYLVVCSALKGTRKKT